jgi:hypothetical protein
MPSALRFRPFKGLVEIGGSRAGACNLVEVLSTRNWPEQGSYSDYGEFQVDRGPGSLPGGLLGQAPTNEAKPGQASAEQCQACRFRRVDLQLKGVGEVCL